MSVTHKITLLYEALSAQEKRYINIWLKKEADAGKTSSHVLNGLINKTKASGKEKIANDKKLFALYQSILRALRSYHEGTSINLELYSLQMNVELLFNKRLYDQSLTELERLKKVALKYNRYGILLSALELEQTIFI